MSLIDVDFEMKQISTNINKNVYDIMIKRNITIEELSKATGISRQSIYHTINNTKIVSFKKAIAFSLFFEIPLNELMLYTSQHSV